jgi:hypothetical protein
MERGSNDLISSRTAGLQPGIPLPIRINFNEELEMGKRTKEPRDTNPDPLTGEPGSHPVGAGVGAAVTGAAAGAAGGALGGPVGAVAGAVIGGVAGGYAGKAVEESLDPTIEDAYWRENYRTRPYAESGREYDYYRPAYQYGWESYGQYRGRAFEEVEPELSRGWSDRSQSSSLTWEKAKQAVRDSWERLEHSTTGDSLRKPR